LPTLPASAQHTGAEPAIRAATARRVVAALVDFSIAGALTFYYWRVLAPRLLLKGRMVAGVGLIFVLLPSAYILLRDALGGKSIGKLLLGLTTVNLAKRRPAGVSDSILRNIIFGFLIVPIVGWAILAVIVAVTGAQILLGRRQRWGDGLARTTVVDDADVRMII
jgi:hypothetical protein